MKFQRIFWGLFFIVAAAVLVGSQTGLLVTGISVFSILATIFLVSILIGSLFNFSIFGTVFALAFLAILYANQLGIASLVPWTILGAALLLSVGLSIIFHNFQRQRMMRRFGSYHHHYAGHTDWHHHGWEHGGTATEQFDGENGNVFAETRFANSVRYIDEADFHHATLITYMGTLKVFFDKAIITGDTANIDVDVNLGSMELYFPGDWKVIDNTSNNLSGVDFHGTSTQTGPTVTLSGRVRLSNLVINFI